MSKNQMKYSLVSSVLALAFAIAPASFAKEVTKKARPNDTASAYVLADNSTLYRVIRGNRCAVTSNVESFKVSQHPNDAAMVYFKKNGDLYVLNASPATRQCPKAETRLIMTDVKKYSVVSNTNTAIVNVALSYAGTFKAWNNTSAVLTVTNADEYQLNQNFGAEGKPFSSYVAFVHTARGGYIMKVKGNSPEASKWDSSHYYSSVADFAQTNGLTNLD
jgi:hypothetical protein